MPRAVMALMFFPRGGSAHVARGLAGALPEAGWDVTVVSGSLRGEGDARAFYDGLDVRPVDFTAALDAPDPLAADPPFHPSFEDRPGAPDRVFATLDEDAFEHQVGAWSAALEDADAAGADVLHLHHLTPLHEAAARVAPEVPVVSHIHGTELLMLEEIAEGRGTGWAYADEWTERMRAWAQASARLVVSNDSQLQRIEDLLGVAADRCLIVPGGFDPERFHPCRVDRTAFWRRWLVDEPRGWKPGAEPGSVRYRPEEIEVLSQQPVLLYVGRFTAVKRIGMLIRAQARAARRLGRPVPLVLVGGHPGEWEGEHPLEAIEAAGAQDVFLAGWHPHSALPEFFCAADAVVLPSVREQFGQVLVEGMACGLPAVAAAAHGPTRIITDGETGWLFPPDDEEALASALEQVVGDEEERTRRGGAALESVRDRYAWPALAARLTAAYEAATSEPAPSPSI